MEHGGGMPWLPGTYDPDLNLLYVTTGNPNPVMAAQSRAGDNLYTSLHRRAESGHRQNGVVFPGLAARHARLGRHADAGPDRRRSSTASRASCSRRPTATVSSSCWTASPARTSCSKPFVESSTGPRGSHANGQPVRNPDKDPKVDGRAGFARLHPASPIGRPPASTPTPASFTWAPRRRSASSTSPIPIRVRRATARPSAMPDKSALRCGPSTTRPATWSGSILPARGAQGLLSTAGGLLFGGDGVGNFVAYDPEDRQAALARRNRRPQQLARNLSAGRPAVRRGGRGRFVVCF